MMIEDGGRFVICKVLELHNLHEWCTLHSELHLLMLGNPPVLLKYFIKSMYNKILSIYNRNINLDHILYLTQGDIVHNTVLALQTLQLYCSHLHQERVLIAIKFQQIVISVSFRVKRFMLILSTSKIQGPCGVRVTVKSCCTDSCDQFQWQTNRKKFPRVKIIF